MTLALSMKLMCSLRQTVVLRDCAPASLSIRSRCEIHGGKVRLVGLQTWRQGGPRTVSIDVCTRRLSATPSLLLFFETKRLLFSNVIRFETKLQQRQARWGSASSSQVYFPPASPLGLHVPAYGPQFPDYQHPSSSNYHPYVPSQQYAAVPSQRFAYASAPLQQVQMQQPSQHVSQQQAKKAPAAAAVQESPVRPPSARQQQQQQRNVKYEVYNSGWI